MFISLITLNVFFTAGAELMSAYHETQSSPVQYSTVKFSIVQYSIVQYSTV